MSNEGAGGFRPESDEKVLLELKHISFESSGKTEGKDERAENEDTVLQNPQQGLFAVFDGKGGHPAGEEASQMAALETLSHLQALPPDSSVEDTKEAVLQTLISANKAILDSNRNRRKETTATIVKFSTEPSGRAVAVIGNVGNSRAYRIDSYGKTEQLTLDDSLYSKNLSPEDAWATQRRLATFREIEELSDEDLIHQYQSNRVSQALGTREDFNPNIYTVPISEGDQIVLTTKGVHNTLRDYEIGGFSSWATNCEDAASKTVAAVKEKVAAKKAPGADWRKNFRTIEGDISIVVIRPQFLS
jgi:protein phosphatase